MFGPARRRYWKMHYLLPARNRVRPGKPISISVGKVSFKVAPVEPMAAFLWPKPRLVTHQVRLLLRFLDPGQIFFDAGAGAGIFAIALAEGIGASSVYAFEPSLERFQLLRRNLDLNGLTELHAMQTALADHTGEASLLADFRGVETSRIFGMHNSAESPRAPITTLDAFIESNAIRHVNALRLGAGGAELPVLQGSRNLLARSDAPLVLCEAYCEKTGRFGYHPAEIMWFLNDCGYDLLVMDPKSGRIAPRKANGRYDALIVAAKSSHAPRLISLGISL